MGFLLDLLILALIAIFVLYRLYSVLGTRSGTEKKRPNSFFSTENKASEEEGSNVVDLKSRKPRKFGFLKPTSEIIDVDFETKDIGVQGGQETLSRMKKVEPQFSVSTFLKGSKAAFELIIQAYAKGDKKALTPLLAGDVFEAFLKGIQKREHLKETLVIQVQSLKAEIINATLHDKTKTAEITVQFDSDQLHTTEKPHLNKENDITKSQEALTLIDIWTFARTLGDNDPNWILVKTSSKIEKETPSTSS